MRIARLLVLAAAVAVFSGVALADTIDPAIGIKGGNLSTPLFEPVFSFTFTGTMGTDITEQDFDFINSTGSTVGELDLLAPGPLAYVCGDFSTYFSSCTTTVLETGQTLIKYLGGSGIPNDSTPSCIEGCFSSVPGADFVMFVTDLNGDLASLPPTDSFTVTGTLIPATVPEPATIVLLSTGLGLVGISRRRKKQAANSVL
jgi:hypothetical protein